MLSVNWNNLGKRFGLKWVFRNLQGEIPEGSHVVIKGNNGSGKSTFGKLLVGATDATDGEIVWACGGEQIEIDDIPQRIAWSSPFMEVPEEMKISEVIDFHSNFREGWSPNSFIDLLNNSGLKSHSEAQIKALSSGQKQRLRLILAIGTKADLVVLDEPCSNLDSSGIQWYGEELQKLVGKTTVVVCSNNRPEEHLGNAAEIHLN
ncbi:MAG: ATP-binding cassette domain-containing protein [Bacteroidota bacterium]|nr:ATP-binding cassette domain-containing protein [Bacteroidota bacterium]